jgi:hypothetical protein
MGIGHSSFVEGDMEEWVWPAALVGGLAVLWLLVLGRSGGS